MFGRKFDLDNVYVQWDGNKPCHWAILCTAANKDAGKGREYTKKDLQFVALIKFRVERDNMNWWEVKEARDKGAFYLYYYPDIHLEASRVRDEELHKGVPDCSGPKELSQSLSTIVKMFNEMLP
jgi:hypothetical protein